MWFYCESSVLKGVNSAMGYPEGDSVHQPLLGARTMGIPGRAPVQPGGQAQLSFRPQHASAQKLLRPWIPAPWRGPGRAPFLGD